MSCCNYTTQTHKIVDINITLYHMLLLHNKKIIYFKDFKLPSLELRMKIKASTCNTST